MNKLEDKKWKMVNGARTITGLDSSSCPATYATPSASSPENSSAIKFSKHLFSINKS